MGGFVLLNDVYDMDLLRLTFSLYFIPLMSLGGDFPHSILTPSVNIMSLSQYFFRLDGGALMQFRCQHRFGETYPKYVDVCGAPGPTLINNWRKMQLKC